MILINDNQALEEANISPEHVQVQRPAYVLGYVAHGDEIAGERASESDVILEGRHACKLVEINEGLSESGVKRAIDAIKNPMVTSLIEANEKVFCAARFRSDWRAAEAERNPWAWFPVPV